MRIELLLVTGFALASTIFAQSARQPYAPAPSEKNAAHAAVVNMPLTFEPNQGQADHRYQYLTGVEQPVYFAPAQVLLPTADGSSIVQMSLVGALTGAESGLEEPTGGVSNYYPNNNREEWRTGVPQYRKLRYKDVYPGIDVLYHGNNGRLEYDFVIQPGADLSKIELSHTGVATQAIDSSGALVLSLAGGGEIRHLRPVAYQIQDGRRHEIAAAYRLAKSGRVQFSVDAYDHRLPLIIDPVLSYLRYLAASCFNEDIGIDASGYLYVGAICGENAMVWKLNPADGSQVYGTVIGGASSPSAAGNLISVNATGQVFVVGTTSSTTFTVVSPFQFLTAAGVLYSGAQLSGSSDGFVTRLDGSGKIDGSSYLGGTGYDYVNVVSVASDGSAVIAGCPSSTYNSSTNTYSDINFPFTSTPPNPNPYDCFFGNIDASFGITSLFVSYDRYAFARGPSDSFYGAECSYVFGPGYSIYLGGAFTCNIQTTALVVDTSGNLYATGYVSDNSLPAVNAYQAQNAGSLDAFIVKIDTKGNLVYSSYLGGIGNDFGYGIAVDSLGNILITGMTASSNFPEQSGIAPIFLLALNPSGSTILYSNFMGTLNGATGSGGPMVIDSNDNAFFVGTTTGAITVSPPTNVYGTFVGGLVYNVFLAKLPTADVALTTGSFSFGPMARKADLQRSERPEQSPAGSDGLLVAGSNLTWQPVLTNLGPDPADNPVVGGNTPFALNLQNCAFSSTLGSGDCLSANNVSVSYPSGTLLTANNTVSLSLTATANYCGLPGATAGCVPADGSVMTWSLTGSSSTFDPNPANNTTSLSFRLQYEVQFQSAPVSGLPLTTPVVFPTDTPTSVLTPFHRLWDPQGTYVFSGPSAPVPGSPGTRYVFSNWSNSGGPLSGAQLSIKPAQTLGTLTANFITQYLVAVAATAGGTVSVKPSSLDGYYTSDSIVQIAATPQPGYVFSGFTGAVIPNPNDVLVSGPLNVTANFTRVLTGRTFVSTTGNDGNNCTASANCRSIAAALTWTSPGGEVVVLNSGGYGPVTISQPVVITAIGVDASISATTAGTNGITIDTAGNVTLTGMKLHGEATGSYGIVVLQVGFLRLDGLLIENFVGDGIYFGAGGALALYDSNVNDNGVGLLVDNPAAAAFVENSAFDDNQDAGVEVFNGNAAVADSSAHYNGAAFLVVVGTLTLVNDRAMFNATALATSSSGTLHFAGCLISDNTTAYNVGAGGTMSGSGTSLITPGQATVGTLTPAGPSQ